jgi:hypothetical protein
MNSKQAVEKCICQGCPTWKICKEKIAFCFNGKSKCIKEKNGCLCGGCPVHKEMDFNKYYYCFSGKDKNSK